ncbi:MAG: MBL fold metallo-hydrolase [Paludibacteraceae bacterium]|nr:MBL fold metallo-hydrolase [Paludibacteraceae bacterium]
MKIERFIFGPFETNTYVVHDEQGDALIVDPACSSQYEQQTLYRYIQLANLQVKAILATHGHLDHLWGAKWACEQWHLPVLMHQDDIPMAEAMQEQYDLFGIRMTAESFPIESLQSSALSHQNQFSIIHSPFSILSTPGHTPGSVCLYWEKEKVLLSGDTLFRMGYGRTDLPGGHFCQLMSSLERLFELPSDVRVYPGHGDTTTIGAENRPFHC